MYFNFIVLSLVLFIKHEEILLFRPAITSLLRPQPRITPSTVGNLPIVRQLPGSGVAGQGLLDLRRHLLQRLLVRPHVRIVRLQRERGLAFLAYLRLQGARRLLSQILVWVGVEVTNVLNLLLVVL